MFGLFNSSRTKQVQINSQVRMRPLDSLKWVWRWEVTFYEQNGSPNNWVEVVMRMIFCFFMTHGPNEPCGTVSPHPILFQRHGFAVYHFGCGFWIDEFGFGKGCWGPLGSNNCPWQAHNFWSGKFHSSLDKVSKFKRI